VVNAIHHSGATQRCWNAFLASDPDAPSVRVSLRVEVAATGAVTSVTVLSPIPPTLLSCVRTQVSRARIPAGAAVTVTTNYGFSAGVPAPIPAPIG